MSLQSAAWIALEAYLRCPGEADETGLARLERQAHALATGLGLPQPEADAAGALQHLIDRLPSQAERFRDPAGGWNVTELETWCRVVMRNWLLGEVRRKAKESA